MSDTPANKRYMEPIADAMIDRFFREQDADRILERASPAERNDWESAASVSEGTSLNQDREGNREDGEQEEDSANEQEEGDLDDREEDGGDNQEKDENEGNHDDGEQQGDQGDAKQDGGARQDYGQDRDDAEDAEDSTDENSVNSGASSSSQVPVEDQILPELEEAISDADSDSSFISATENLPPLPTSSPTPGSPGATLHLVALDQVSSSASQVNTQASFSTQAIPNNDDSSPVALANLLEATGDPESLPFPFGPCVAASDSASASSSVPTSNHIDEPSFLDNSSGVKTHFEPSTSGAKLEIEERGENNELEGELESKADQGHGSISAPQFNLNDAPGLVSGPFANVSTTRSSNSAAPLPFNSSQSFPPNQVGPSSLLGFIPQTLRNLIANTVQPSLTSPSSIPLPASSPETPSAATQTPPNLTFSHEVSPSSIPANDSAVPSSFADFWPLVSPRDLNYTSFTPSPLVNPWVSLPATDRSHASTPLSTLASAPMTRLSLRSIPSSPEGGNLIDTLASTGQQTNLVDSLPPTSPGNTTTPQQEINSGDSSAPFTSTSKYDLSLPSPPSETSSIIFDTLPATEPESGWAPNPDRFRVNRRRCPMCVRRAKSFQHACHGGPPCDACATLGYSAEQCRTGEVGEGGGGRHERSGRKGGKSGRGGFSGNIGEVA